MLPRKDIQVPENAYDTDFYTWTQNQARLLRSGRMDHVDVANIAEELETLGRSEARALKSTYKLIATHLLKAIHQPEKATRSWDATITEQRQVLADILADNPGLKPQRQSTFAQAYSDARQKAVSETGMRLDVFPVEPQFTIDQAEDVGWLPPSITALRTQKTDGKAIKAKGRGPAD